MGLLKLFIDEDRSMSKTRAAYYLLLIALLMPALPDSKPASDKSVAAKTAAVEVPAGRSFCSSPDGICGATTYLLRKFEAKAKFPIHVLTNWANQANPERPESQA